MRQIKLRTLSFSSFGFYEFVRSGSGVLSLHILWKCFFEISQFQNNERGLILSDKNYQLKFVKSGQDQRIAKELFASCFSAHDSYFNHYQSLEKQLKFNPELKSKNYWLIFQGEQLIGATQIFILPIRVGISTLEIGGIGGVCTLPEFRKQGFNEALLNHCLDQMKKLNLDLTMLGGIPNYYHRYGYVPIFPNYQFKVQTRKLFEFEQTHSIRKFTPEDLPGLERLFQQEFSELTGTHVRTSEFWQYQFKLTPAIYVAENAEKQLTGYVWLDTGKQIRIKEAVSENGSAIESLLRFVAEEAHQRFQSEITGHLHPEQPFVRFLLPGCDIEMMTDYRRNGGWMGRIIHLDAAFKKLVPELSRRLQKTAFCSAELNLGFKTELGDLVLACKQGQVQVVHNQQPTNGFFEISQTTLTQMIFGYYAFDDLVAIHQLQVPKAYLPVIQALFPKKMAYIGAPDRF